MSSQQPSCPRAAGGGRLFLAPRPPQANVPALPSAPASQLRELTPRLTPVRAPILLLQAHATDKGAHKSGALVPSPKSPLDWDPQDEEMQSAR